MSDDFGGKSYELEKKEGEENNSDGENEDDDEFEKEMGNTGEEAETLDQQVIMIFIDIFCTFNYYIFFDVYFGFIK